MTLGDEYSTRCPFHILPDEMISKILEEAWKTVKQSLLLSDLFAFPHLTMLVCKRWRNVTLATPILWSFVVFDPSKRMKSSYFSLRLGLSKACPIFVKFIYLPSHIPTDHPAIDYEPVMNILQLHKRRIWSLHCILPNIPCFYVLSKTIGYDQDGLPTTCLQSESSTPAFVSPIRKLSLVLPPPDSTDPDQGPIYVPDLEFLECWVMRLPTFIFSATPSIPGTHGKLKRLDIFAPESRLDLLLCIASIISQNPGLQSVSLGQISFPPGTPPRQPVRLENLKYLRLVDWSGDTHTISTLLSLFDAPNLTDAAFGKINVTGEGDLRVLRMAQRVAFLEYVPSGLMFCPSSFTHLALVKCTRNPMAYLSAYMRTGDITASLTGHNVSVTVQFPYLHTVISRENSLPELINVIRNQMSTIRTVQIFSQDLVWKTTKKWRSVVYSNKAVLMQDHWGHIEWIKQNFILMIWGPRFSDELVKGDNHVEVERDSESWVSVVCDGLPWVDESEVWTGESPLLVSSDMSPEYPTICISDLC